VDEGGLSTFEPHYTDIVEEDEVQVYELVAVDVTGTPTNVLERAAGSAKDNRLLPLGFSHAHPVYDTTRVEGAALMDDDFVEEAAAGLDRVHYAMTATPTSNANVTVDVRVWYQSMPARWVAPMFDIQDSTIQAFQALFEDQGAAPELVSEKSLSIPVTTGTADLNGRSALRVYPNPAPMGLVTVQAPDAALGGLWELYTPAGSRVTHGAVNRNNWQLELPLSAGTYVLRVHHNGKTWTRRIVRR
jgi:hypothetical protein